MHRSSLLLSLHHIILDKDDVAAAAAAAAAADDDHGDDDGDAGVAFMMMMMMMEMLVVRSQRQSHETTSTDKRRSQLTLAMLSPTALAVLSSTSRKPHKPAQRQVGSRSTSLASLIAAPSRSIPSTRFHNPSPNIAVLIPFPYVLGCVRACGVSFREPAKARIRVCVCLVWF